MDTSLSPSLSPLLAGPLAGADPLVLLAALVAIAAGFFCLAVFLFFRCRMLSGRLRLQEEDLAAARNQLGESDHSRVEQQIRAEKLASLLESEQRSAGEKLQLLEQAREELRLQFESLANRIFEEKSEKFGSQSRERLETILRPFHEQLASFRKEIGDIYVSDTRERSSLKQEIIHLRELNRQIGTEALNLTRALKGDRKIQGNWGEMVLERILEQSGLRRGHEYECQEGLRDPDSRLLRPDVIVRLPEGRDIVIDAKVSLISWERAVSADDERERNRALADLVAAVRDHITTLAGKKYSELAGIRSLDFVIMFMPIEAAFVAAFQHDGQLFDEAFRRGIIVTTPTTLLATLRTVENIWRYEHQSRNAQEIARRAGLIHDKLCGFVEEMEKIGRQLATCQQTYETAMSRLSQGRGNLIAQAGQLTELGVTSRREMPRSVADRADSDLQN